MHRALLRFALITALTGAVSLPAPSFALQNFSGAYLAASQADIRNDYRSAARYYSKAIAGHSDDLALIERALIIDAALGDFERGRKRADILLEAMPENQIAVLVKLADLFSKENYGAAGRLLNQSSEILPPLLGGLLAGWIEVGKGNYDKAQAVFDKIAGNDALRSYGQYHKALALALVGDFVSAERIMAGENGTPLHVNIGAVLSHAQILAQLGRETDAVNLLENILSGGAPNPPADALYASLSEGKEVAFTHVPDVRRGAALAFMTLADALDNPDSERIALIHARIATHISPDLVDGYVLTSELLAGEEQYELASEALENISQTDPWAVMSQIRRAGFLHDLGRAEAGIELLKGLTESQPDSPEVFSALGDSYRDEKAFEDAAAAYSSAIELVGPDRPAHWLIYYSRAISYERSGAWDKAEADFRKALELQPEQPLVLNYLGYSLVEKGLNLDEALKMIETAVDRRPNDGYIRDSLGWVLYRLERFEDAVPHMLRAVELTPDDPVVNDHLGDVLWSVGRHREAKFQWRRALSFGPAEDLDMELIRRKLEVGLERATQSEGAATTDG